MKLKNMIYVLLLISIIAMLTGCSLFEKNGNASMNEDESATEGMENTTEDLTEDATKDESATGKLEDGFVEESNSTGENLTSSNTVVKEEYKYFYDTNRDGIVTEAEITAHDKRFYGGEPTTQGQKKVLLAGYYVAVDLGNDIYGIMVKLKQGPNGTESEYGLGGDLLEETLQKKGYAATNRVGGMLDEERYLVTCKAEPIKYQLDSSANFDEKIFEKVYGYAKAKLQCSRYVKYGFNTGNLGTKRGDAIEFNFQEILTICGFMSKKNPADYLEHCPDPINKVYVITDENHSYYLYAITVDEQEEYSTIEKLVNEMKSLAQKEFPGYVHNFDWGNKGFGEDYIEGRLETYCLNIFMPTNTTKVECNQIGQEFKDTLNGNTSINRIDSIECNLRACDFQEVYVEIIINISSVVWTRPYDVCVSICYRIFNSSGECVVDYLNKNADGAQGRFREGYRLPPDTYTIVFYDKGF